MRVSLLAMLLAATVAEAQQYDVYIDSANSAYNRKDYLRSTLYFDSAFKADNPTPPDLYNAACSNALAGKREVAIWLLNKAYSAGYRDFDLMHYDIDLDPLRNEKKFLDLEAKFKPDTAIYLSDLIGLLRKQSKVVISNKWLSLSSEQHYLDRVKTQLKLESVDSLIDFSEKILEFDGCTFNNSRECSLGFLALKSLVIDDSRGELLTLTHLNLNDLVINNNEFKEVVLEKTNTDGIFQFFTNEVDHIRIIQSNFSSKTRKLDMVAAYRNNVINVSDSKYMLGIFMYDHPANSVTINDSYFRMVAAGKEATPFEFYINTGQLSINSTLFELPLEIRGVASNALRIQNSRFLNFVDFSKFRFPEFNCYIPFSQFESPIVRLDGLEVQGDSLADYKDRALFDDLVNVHKQLYNNYRVRGELASANASYVRLKELEIAHLQLKPDRTSEESIRLRLNQLMGFYTDHGTSPGKAIIISFYLILAFAVFYFFFPSEWDKETKAKLIEDYRTFIQKNEHGYFKPFLKMMQGFLLSFLNAVTLSMNAFVTLGFGTIPTVGVARYVCVFQGMLGWFLLSLFTVALINQVLL